MDPKVKKFTESMSRFKEALKYIEDHQEELVKDLKRYGQIQRNFQAQFSDPLDAAWLDLNPVQRKRFSTIYWFRTPESKREFATPQAIADEFNGKIIDIEEKA